MAAERLGNGRVTLKKAAFADLQVMAQESGIDTCDGILLDLWRFDDAVEGSRAGFQFSVRT